MSTSDPAPTLETIKTHLSTHQTSPQTTFQSSLRPFLPPDQHHTNMIDPTSLPQTISQFTRQFENFQQIYLEQQAKDQYLRFILEEDDREVTYQVIEREKVKNEALRVKVHAKEHEARGITREVEAKAEMKERLIDQVKEKASEVEKLQEKVKDTEQHVNEIQTKYGDKLGSQDPLFLELAAKTTKFDIRSTDLHSTQSIAKHTAEITRKRIETQSKIEKLRKLKERKQSEIKTSQLERVQLLAQRDTLHVEIEELKKKDDDTENVKEKESYVRHNMNFMVLEGALSGVITAEAVSVVDNDNEGEGKVLSFQFMEKPDVTIKLHITSNTKQEGDITITTSSSKESYEDINIIKIECDELRQDLKEWIVRQSRLVNRSERLSSVVAWVQSALLKMMN